MCVGGFIVIGMSSLECWVYRHASIPITHIVFCISGVVLPVRTNMIHSLLWGLYSGACLSIIVCCILVWSSSWHFVWPHVASRFLRASLYSWAKTLSVYRNNCVGIAGIGFARHGWGGARHSAICIFFFALGFGCLNVLGTFSLVQIPTFDAFRSPCEGDHFGSSFFRFWWPELPRYIPPYTDGYSWAFAELLWGGPLREASKHNAEARIQAVSSP